MRRAVALGDEGRAAGGRRLAAIVAVGGVDADADGTGALDQAHEEVALAAADLQHGLAAEAVLLVLGVDQPVHERHEVRREGLGLLVSRRIGDEVRIEAVVLDEAAGLAEGELEIAFGKTHCRRAVVEQQAAVRRDGAELVERPEIAAAAGPAGRCHAPAVSGINRASKRPASICSRTRLIRR